MDWPIYGLAGVADVVREFEVIWWRKGMMEIFIHRSTLVTVAVDGARQRFSQVIDCNTGVHIFIIEAQLKN